MSATDMGIGTLGVRNDPLTVCYPEMRGRVAVVSGAAGGIGRVLVSALAAQGVNVVAADLADGASFDEPGDASPVDPLRHYSGTVTYEATDISSPSANQALVQQAIEQHGHLDFFVATAAIYGAQSPAIELTPRDLREVLAVNLEGQLFGAQAAARVMQPGSAIVLFSSSNATRPRSQRGAYSVSKGAIEHTTRVLALELGTLGIRVNAIAPGLIDTEKTRQLAHYQESLTEVVQRIPLGRIGSPVEVLGALLFLLSDSSRYITGHVLPVDGGVLLC